MPRTDAWSLLNLLPNFELIAGRKDGNGMTTPYLQRLDNTTVTMPCSEVYDGYNSAYIANASTATVYPGVYFLNVHVKKNTDYVVGVWLKGRKGNVVVLEVCRQSAVESRPGTGRAPDAIFVNYVTIEKDNEWEYHEMTVNSGAYELIEVNYWIGTNGQSAYIAKPSLQESRKGDKGDPGKQGEQGKSATSYRLQLKSGTEAKVVTNGSGDDVKFTLSAIIYYLVIKNTGGSDTEVTDAKFVATIEGKDRTVLYDTKTNKGYYLEYTGTTAYTATNTPQSAIPLTVTLADGTVLNDSIPVTIQPGVAIDINQKLATMTTTLADQKGDINTIRSTANSNSARISNHDGRLNTVEQTANGNKSTISTLNGRVSTVEQTARNISLKVQEIERKPKNLLSGGNVTGLYVKKYYVGDSSAFTMEQGKTYTVTACLWIGSASNGNNIKAYVVGVNNDWTYSYSSGDFKNTSRSVVRFKFEAKATKQMIVRFYERNSSGEDPGSYNGMHIDWVRVDEGDWTGTGDNGKTLDKWEPSEAETDAVNLLPDPDFSETIGYSDAMGDRNSYDKNMGDAVPWMSKDGSTVDGAHGVLFSRSGATTDTSAGLRYIVPFKGVGTYSISCFIKDLRQTDSSKPTWDSGKYFAIECNPLDADKTKITDGFAVRFNQDSQRLGDEQGFKSYTFGSTAVRSGTTTEVKIAYLEVRVFLQRNGSVRVSRLCLSKSDHFIYWNANEVSEERKKEAAQLATGIDIYNKRVDVTADNFTVRNNKGEMVLGTDADKNLSVMGTIKALNLFHNVCIWGHNPGAYYYLSTDKKYYNYAEFYDMVYSDHSTHVAGDFEKCSGPADIVVIPYAYQMTTQEKESFRTVVLPDANDYEGKMIEVVDTNYNNRTVNFYVKSVNGGWFSSMIYLSGDTIDPNSGMQSVTFNPEDKARFVSIRSSTLPEGFHGTSYCYWFIIHD